MPTFYWVGNGCPKDGTSSTSHLWGISEYSWNNPSNWIVAHSLHEVPVGSGTANVFRKKVEVYAVPNRVPVREIQFMLVTTLGSLMIPMQTCLAFQAVTP